MKWAARLLKGTVVLIVTFLLTQWWMGTIWSERYWTWLNHLLGGQRLGLASDVELVTVLIFAASVSSGFLYFVVKVFRQFRK
ncbi:MAG: hypothetical protein LW710_02610 [Burkholderiales bacterium]|jgi:hypothetical protein|uniref:hypothetical protein n=1 Tax=Limnobacter sp. TaxID=2003368 RepID=UPI003954FDE5|nr:hypothetical protein [Burkholderiales bacterium]